MTSKSADLHIHTSYSDGLYNPTEIVTRAKKANLKAIAITDHDTVGGLIEAKMAGAEQGVEVISGVELSCELDSNEIHILGYFASGKEDLLEEKLEWYQSKRQERMLEILYQLRLHGIHLEVNQVKRFSQGKSIGRLHVAKALIENGMAHNVHEVFYRFLGPDGVAYVPKTKLTVEEAVTLIHEHQGVAVLAHPGMYRISDAAERTMDYLDGLEVWYPEHSPALEDKFYALAIRNHLIPTGGSDYHGLDRVDIGSVRVPYSIVTRLMHVAVGV